MQRRADLKIALDYLYMCVSVSVCVSECVKEGVCVCVCEKGCVDVCVEYSGSSSRHPLLHFA